MITAEMQRILLLVALAATAYLLDPGMERRLHKRSCGAGCIECSGRHGAS